MDEFNNERGIQSSIELLKRSSFEDGELFDRAKDEIRIGNLKILNHEKQRNDNY